VKKEDIIDDELEETARVISVAENGEVTVFQDYFNGRMVRFLEYNERLYVDADDLALLLTKPTKH